MSDEIDYCQYIRNIAKDPKAKVPRLKVSQFLKLRMHVQSCEKCDILTEKVLKGRPKKTLQDGMSEN